jgi:hypothetical protein
MKAQKKLFGGFVLLAVTVACSDLAAPATVAVIPAVTVEVGDVETLYLDRYFDDADELTFRISSSDTSRVGVSLSGRRALFEGRRKGVAQVTLEAFRDSLGSHEHIAVTVPNRPPELAIAPPLDTLTIVSNRAARRSVAGWFKDLDDDDLTYTFDSRDPSIAVATLDGSYMVVTGVSEGETEISVTAHDGEDASTPLVLPVAVNEALFTVEVEWLTPDVDAAAKAIVDSAALTWQTIVNNTVADTVTFRENDILCDNTIVVRDDFETAGVRIYAARIDFMSALAGALPCAWRGGSGKSWPEESPQPGQFASVGLTIYSGEAFELPPDELYSVALHEIGHVLGIGAMWSGEIRGVSKSDPHFPGPSAVDAFDAADGTSYAGGKVPVQLEILAHWRFEPMWIELMAPYHIPGTHSPLSAITLGALADLGWTIEMSLAEPYSILDGAAAEVRNADVIDLSNDITEIRRVLRDGTLANFLRNNPKN